MIVDDHAVVRRGVRAYLEARDDMAVAAEAADGQDALDQLAKMAAHASLPDVVLLDLVMPRMDGVAAASLITSRHPAVRVVILTSFGEMERVHAALAGGAVGYLLKDAGPAEAATAILAAARDGTYLDPAIARRLTREISAPRSGLNALTERERAVLVLVAHGRSNQEIADELVISERTARTHVSHVLRKLQLTSRTQAALVAVREGLSRREPRRERARPRRETRSSYPNGCGHHAPVRITVLGRLARAVGVPDLLDERCRGHRGPDADLPVSLDGGLGGVGALAPQHRDRRAWLACRRVDRRQRHERVLVGEVAKVKRKAGGRTAPQHLVDLEERVARLRHLDELGRGARLAQRTDGEGEVVGVPHQRHLRPVLLGRDAFQRPAAEEVVIELDAAAVADVIRRDVVVGDVAGVHAAAERAERARVEPLTVTSHLRAEDGGHRRRD